jgi:TolA-binding protein
VPSPGAQNRTLAALGVGGAALSAAVTASSAKAAAAGVGKTFGFGKLLAVLVIGGTAGGAALHYRAQFKAEKAENAHPAAADAPSRALQQRAMPPPPPGNAPAAADASHNPDSAATTVPDVLPSSAKTPTPAPARAEPDIALEIAALDRARRASERGDFGGALGELDQYDHDFKQGRLRPEALLLRVQTLINKGDVVGAKALGSRFLARYPKSPLSPRIQKLIGQTL